MKKILFILEYFLPHVWWSETLFDNVIRWLLEKWYSVTVLTSQYATHLQKEESMVYWNKTVQILRVWTNRYNFMRYGLWKALSVAQKQQFDLIQTATFNAALVAWILRIIKKIPTILHVHEIYIQLRYTFFWWKGFFYKLFERLIFQFRFDFYTCSSFYTKNSLRLHFGIADKKLVTTYCWIDYTLRDKETVKQDQIQQLSIQYWWEKHYIWLYFWRSWVAKWLLDYIQAIPYILEHIPHFKALLIVPKYENARSGVIKSTIANDDVTSLIDRLQIQQSVVRIDSVPYTELKNYIMMSDVVVLPTMAEWFGLAIAEVCALWKPLVTTNVWSVPEVVCGEKIQLVEPANPQDIARGVVDVFKWKVMSIPEKRFLWKECVEKFISVYERIWK
jgi:D-inositol-3-phosphate glycosyltransferase